MSYIARDTAERRKGMGSAEGITKDETSRREDPRAFPPESEVRSSAGRRPFMAGDERNYEITTRPRNRNALFPRPETESEES